MLCTTCSSIKFMDLTWSSQDTSWQSDEGVLSRWTCWMDLVDSDTCRVDHQWQWKIKVKKSEVWNLQNMAVAPVRKHQGTRTFIRLSMNFGFLHVLLGPTWPQFLLQCLGRKVHGRDLAKLRRTVALMEELKSLGRKRLGGLSGSVGWCTCSLGRDRSIWTPSDFSYCHQARKKVLIESGFCCEELRYKAPKRQDTKKTINNALLVCIL